MNNKMLKQKEKKYKETVEMEIKRFLSDNFNGNENAIPSIIVKGIADKIYDIRHSIYNLVQEEADMEDIFYVYEYKEVEASPEEIVRIMNKYKKCKEESNEEFEYLIDLVQEEIDNRESLSSSSE